MNSKGYYLALFIDDEFDHVLATSNDIEELKSYQNALNEQKAFRGCEYKVEKIQQFYNEAKLIEEE